MKTKLFPAAEAKTQLAKRRAALEDAPGRTVEGRTVRRTVTTPAPQPPILVQRADGTTEPIKLADDATIFERAEAADKARRDGSVVVDGNPTTEDLMEALRVRNVVVERRINPAEPLDEQFFGVYNNGRDPVEAHLLAAKDLRGALYEASGIVEIDDPTAPAPRPALTSQTVAGAPKPVVA